MKFTIISGSPKGSNSVTLQYLLYIQKHHPEHEYEIFDVGQKIKVIEKNQDKFSEIIESVETSDGVFWITPIYYFLIPSQLKRFIELIYERNAVNAFKGKYATAVSTSIRFFDMTAHNYLHAVSDDLEMKYLGFNSLDMWDIFARSKREQFIHFAENFFSCVENKVPVSRRYSPLPDSDFKYEPGLVKLKVDNTNKKVVVLTDGYNKGKNLGKMIDQLSDTFTKKVEIYEIESLGIKGGCLGCGKCCYDNVCVYKDNFTDFWKTRMKSADIIIFAGEIRDRYLSANFKMVFDRSFFMNHTPFLVDKQMGFLITGSLSRVDNLSNLFSAYVESQNSNFIDFVTDENKDSKDIDSLIHAMADQAVSCSKKGYIRPHTFYKEGGMKIFRDDVYGRLRFICQADHRWYKKNGIYDTFPQRNKFTKKMNRKYMLLTRFKPFRERLYNTANKEMVRPVRKIALAPGK